MNRTRTALIALLAAVAVPGLAACSGGSGGGTAHTGSAAVVGGQRITIATVQDQTAAFRQAAPATGSVDASGKTWGQDSAGVDANVLGFLLQAQLTQAALDQKGLRVSASDVSAVEQPVLQKVGGQAQLTALFVNRIGLPPQDMDAYFRLDAGQQTLLKNAGATPTSPADRVAELNALLRPVATSLGVSVNPRYGSWDASNLTLAGASQPWIKQVSQDNAG